MAYKNTKYFVRKSHVYIFFLSQYMINFVYKTKNLEYIF